jgi:hypothetical protein
MTHTEDKLLWAYRGMSHSGPPMTFVMREGAGVAVRFSGEPLRIAVVAACVVIEHRNSGKAYLRSTDCQRIVPQSGN